jgi:hypothetical protein
LITKIRQKLRAITLERAIKKKKKQRADTKKEARKINNWIAP